MLEQKFPCGENKAAGGTGKIQGRGSFKKMELHSNVHSLIASSGRGAPIAGAAIVDAAEPVAGIKVVAKPMAICSGTANREVGRHAL